MRGVNIIRYSLAQQQIHSAKKIKIGRDNFARRSSLPIAPFLSLPEKLHVFLAHKTDISLPQNSRLTLMDRTAIEEPTKD